MTSNEWPYGPPSQMYAPARAARPGVETRQVLLSLGALCLIVALSAGTALVWGALGPNGQIALMAGVTLMLLTGAATLRKLPATAEALAAVGLVGCAIDAIAGRSLHLSFAVGMPTHSYVALAALAITGVAVLLAAAAPRLTSPEVAWLTAVPVGLISAGLGSTAGVRGAGAIALLSLAAYAQLPVATGGLRKLQIAASTLAIPGFLAWLSVFSDAELLAAVDYALAIAAAGVVVAWPRLRTGASQIRGAAMGVTALLASVANDITLNLHHVTTPEAYLATPAALTLAWGAWLLYRDRQLTSAVLVPGLVMGLLPTLGMALGHDPERQAVLLVVATVIVAIGAELRLGTPLAAGSVVIGLLSLRLAGPQLVTLPHWIVWGAAGAVLLTLGATWEARVADAHRLSDVLRPHIAKLR